MLLLTGSVWVYSKSLSANAIDEIPTTDTVDTERNTDVVESSEPENTEEQPGEIIRDILDEELTEVQDDSTVLYEISAGSSTGNRVGSSFIVGGRAVVFINSSDVQVNQGDYLTDDQILLQDKIKEFTDKTSQNEATPEWSLYRESSLNTIEIPEGTKEIKEFTFARSGLTSVTIPEGVTKIGYAAFYHCDDLAEVTIPSTVTEIEAHAFEHTPWYERFLQGTDNHDPDDPLKDYLIVGDGVLIAYRGDTENPVIPDSVKVIADGVFAN